MPKPYSVGYGRPPVESRFKPGQSGNPAGRPKGRRNFQTMVRRCLEEEIEVSIGGAKKKKIPLMEAIFRRLLSKALSGDHKAVVQALNLASLYDGTDVDSGARDPATEAQQLELLRQLLRGAPPVPDPNVEG